MGSQPTSNPLIENLLCWIDKAGEAILALKPVTFRYKEELDPAGVPQFGLVAEQVEKVDPSRCACVASLDSNRVMVACCSSTLRCSFGEQIADLLLQLRREQTFR
jgi:hypothetical protein